MVVVVIFVVGVVVASVFREMLVQRGEASLCAFQRGLGGRRERAQFVCIEGS